MIRIRGAREHNLSAVDLDLPQGRLIVCCGPSGSGKTSLALDTVHAEGRRRYLDALSFGLRLRTGPLPRPAFDSLDGLPPTVAVEQIQPPLGRQDTVGSASQLLDPLRVLFGRAGTLHDPTTGAPLAVTAHDTIVEEILGLPEGTRLHIEAPLFWGGDAAGSLQEVIRAGFSRVRSGGEVRSVEEILPAQATEVSHVVVDRIKVGPNRADRVHEAVRVASRVGRGVVEVQTPSGRLSFRQRAIGADGEPLPELSPRLFRTPGAHGCAACGGSGEQGGEPCTVCDGTGLGPVARAVTWRELTWGEVGRLSVHELSDVLRQGPAGGTFATVVEELDRRLLALLDLDLGHLTLSRAARTLSTGEWQRVRLATHLGARLSGVLFVVDEPESGLDPARVRAVHRALCALRDLGNTVVVVAHHPLLIEQADHVVEFGPGPGPAGGRVVYEGPPHGLQRANTATGRALRGEILLDRTRVEGRGELRVGADLPVQIGAWNLIVGPSGSGKSRALEALVSELDGGAGEAVGIERVIRADSRAAGGGRRSMPATYVGLWSEVRDLLSATSEAKVRGLEARSFSLAVPGGRCEACEGLGSRRISLDVVPDIEVVCDVCEGRRFSSDVLEVTWKGWSAAEILASTADEAMARLAGHPKLEEPLRALREVGLGYVPLGQPVDTLSGGEQRRLYLARELVRAIRRGAEDTLVVLDDPTAGLHPADVPTLVGLVDRLVGRGATVVMTSHHAPLEAVADRVIRLGGEGPDQASMVAGSSTKVRRT